MVADPIQGVTSTTQSPPSTSGEIADAVTGINAGLNPIDVGGFGPDPIREHTAFLSDVWVSLLDSQYLDGTSYLATDGWIHSAEGLLYAMNEDDHAVSLDIALSLEILPEVWGIDQESLDFLSSIQARYGVAWATMSGNQNSEDILVWWLEWESPEGLRTEIGPLNTIDQDEIDIIRTVVPLMDGTMDDPQNYNFGGIIVIPSSIWSDFRDTVNSVSNNAIGAIVGVTTTSAIVAGSALAGAAATGGTAAVTAAAPVVAGAGAAIIGTVAAALVIVGLTAEQAYDRLLQQLEALGYNTDLMTEEEIEAVARSIFN